MIYASKGGTKSKIKKMLLQEIFDIFRTGVAANGKRTFNKKIQMMGSRVYSGSTVYFRRSAEQRTVLSSSTGLYGKCLSGGI